MRLAGEMSLGGSRKKGPKSPLLAANWGWMALNAEGDKTDEDDGRG